MNRIDRLNALLIHLQSKPRVTLSELEDRFEIGRRTVFRDIRSLIDAGVPIGGEAGEGYFIVEGYHLPPVVFNKEEAAAILMGAKFVEQNADVHTIQEYEKAMYKIKAVLKYSDKEFLDNLNERVAIRPSPTPRQPVDSHIAEIQQAIATNRLVSMTYYSQYNDSTTSREVEPLGMVFYSGRWHLIAFCRLRRDLRDFRTDRIQKVNVLPEIIDPAKHPNYLDFLNEALIGTDAKEATIKCTAKAARFMGEQKYFQGFVEETKLQDGHYQMKFVTPYYDYFARWLMMYGNEIEILSPSELQGIAATIAKNLLEHHSAPFLVKT
ncbi:Predicted DNA-binding transcriptional regulator YafY, contains an HTH and WYL domains [Ekhidna lutea]|uniref:Predicted DNA-binding transcriptional regulator YafY, contains an HTH and WYL domains n=1 Tax=Ekhidna lutea TaxID=447679 RepID=A0A239KM15_EKHLU|nr:YafY family protein [Ekhidna lutea]SNT19191.1 Predicted DNA-binding transcriptional regulator YafY, contains an HTH and WYL domains [Ekhidna lutea]